MVRVLKLATPHKVKKMKRNKQLLLCEAPNCTIQGSRFYQLLRRYLRNQSPYASSVKYPRYSSKLKCTTCVMTNMYCIPKYKAKKKKQHRCSFSLIRPCFMLCNQKYNSTSLDARSPILWSESRILLVGIIVVHYALFLNSSSAHELLRDPIRAKNILVIVIKTKITICTFKLYPIATE